MSAMVSPAEIIAGDGRRGGSRTEKTDRDVPVTCVRMKCENGEIGKRKGEGDGKELVTTWATNVGFQRGGGGGSRPAAQGIERERERDQTGGCD